MDSAKRDEYQTKLSRLMETRNRLGAIRDLERRNHGLTSEQHAEAMECHKNISLLDRELKDEGVLDSWGFLTTEALSLDLRKS